MSPSTLDQLLLELHRDRAQNRFVAAEYLDDYWALVAYTDGYFAGRGHRPDPRWDAFKAWLSDLKIIEGSEGWRLAIPRLAEKESRAPAQLLFELLERFDREQRLR